MALRRRASARSGSASPPRPHTPSSDGAQRALARAVGAGPPPAPAPEETSLQGLAKVFLYAVCLLAVGAAFVPLSHLSFGMPGWSTFFVLATCAAIAQLFVVRTPRDQSYHTTIAVLIPATLLLSPELIALVGIVYGIPEWLKVRCPWYIQRFNIANHTLNGLAAWAAVEAVRSAGLRRRVRRGRARRDGRVRRAEPCPPRGDAPPRPCHTFRATGLFSAESLSTDVVLATLGVAFAGLWKWNPLLLPTAVAPLLLIHRSLSVPALQQEARVDAKTGLFNARHFAAALREELARAKRSDSPLAVVMADLDLLRDINNAHGHVAGDAVLRGVASAFHSCLRQSDVPARFGGEEFAILLPETTPVQAREIAERIRRAVADMRVDVETSNEPIHATVSMGIAVFPKDGASPNELIHQADLAVYRAKLQGRNRVLAASAEPLLVPAERTTRLAAVPDEGAYAAAALKALADLPDAAAEERIAEAHQRPNSGREPRFLALSPALLSFVAAVSLGGVAAGTFGFLLGASSDLVGLLAVLALVTAGQALSLELEGGLISVSAAGALAGVALFGPKAALLLAAAIAAVDWSARRTPVYQLLFNVGALSFASLAAAGAFALGEGSERSSMLLAVAAGLAAGAAYFLVNTALLSIALGLEGRDSWRRIWKDRFAWLLPHYVAFGAIGAAIALAYEAIQFYGLAVLLLPVLLMRKTMAAYLGHTERSTKKLREAAETIRVQNISLERANRRLRERSTAAMESLSATVDARDSYTAGHSRRVQQLALAVGREPGLSRAELDLLGQAALFHDIGKLAVPDEILLKPTNLAQEEWSLMQGHADEGARIIDRLGFLGDAVPAIRHHHERWDGSGYPDGLAGEEIPLGARIIHVADALDSMLTTRIYRPARPVAEALQEFRRSGGTQFCPRCVDAVEELLDNVQGDDLPVVPPARRGLAVDPRAPVNVPGYGG
jgi:diguanylate cyclase (GGDEF)-like protein/putative nucleotidyltransferase with HDIG domain